MAQFVSYEENLKLLYVAILNGKLDEMTQIEKDLITYSYYHICVFDNAKVNPIFATVIDRWMTALDGEDRTAVKPAETQVEIKKRLEYLRQELKKERISYEELSELQSLAEYIDKDDVELLEAAGIPEGGPEADQPTPENEVTRRLSDALIAFREAAVELSEAHGDGDGYKVMEDFVIDHMKDALYPFKSILLHLGDEISEWVYGVEGYEWFNATPAPTPDEIQPADDPCICGAPVAVGQNYCNGCRAKNLPPETPAPGERGFFDIIEHSKGAYWVFRNYGNDNDYINHRLGIFSKEDDARLFIDCKKQ
jgi:hypothetical protein